MSHLNPRIRSTLILFTALCALVAVFYVVFTLSSDAPQDAQTYVMSNLAGVSVTLILLFNLFVVVSQNRNIRLLKGSQTELSHELSLKEEALKALSRLDEVTGLMNRLNFEEELYDEWRRCYRERKPLSMILIRFDHFAPFCGKFAPEEQDRLLSTYAQALQQGALGHRAGDYFARYDSHTFALVLSHCGYKDLPILCGRIAQRWKATDYRLPYPLEETQTITCSIGGATLEMQDDRPPVGEIITLAERAVGEAWEQGGDQITVVVSGKYEES